MGKFSWGLTNFGELRSEGRILFNLVKGYIKYALSNYFHKQLINLSLLFSNRSRREKTCLWSLRTTKAQTSLLIRAVWSEPFFFAD